MRNEFVDKLDKAGSEMKAEEKELMIEEHCAAFKHNNAIIKGFNIGWGTFFIGLVKMIPMIPKVVVLPVVAIISAILIYRS
eukprot:gene12803-16062_t